MEKDLDVTAVDYSLKKIARGGGLLFIGTVFGMGLHMVNRVLIVRSMSRTDYGIFSMGLVIFTMAGTLSQGGFSLSVPRFLGYYRGKKDKERIMGVIRSSFEVELILAAGFLAFLFLGAGFLEDFYDMEGLTIIVRIFAVGIPVFILTQLITDIFRGFDEVAPTFYFSNILLAGSRMTFLLVVALRAPSLLHTVAAYVAAMVATGILASFYYVKKRPIRGIVPITMRKELLLFSIPLFGTVFLAQIMKWTDVLMLGYFTPPDQVGLYNGAIPICVSIPVFLNSAGFIFIPVLSVLYSHGQFLEMKKTYSILTKWIFSATLPLFLVIFIFAPQVLTLLFGADYQQASTALRILSAGYMFHVSTGPIGQNLVIFGRPRLIMANNVAGVVVNIILNFFLIPRYGINGAAIATSSTYVALNVLALLQVYRISGMHPFSITYVKPLSLSLVLSVISYAAFRYGFPSSYWMIPLAALLITGSYLLMILVTKSFDREDVMLLKTVERRSGIRLTWMRKILKKFL
ncbi:MAG: flippase [Candidatus Methanofastidiosia archaeon]